MLEAFKIKEFNLTPVLEAWDNPPMFYGDRKKDMAVSEWLDKVKTGCIERKVPEEYWYKVAQHCMGPTAKARLTELKNVLAQINGGKYRWTWKKFGVAMKNMGWEIDTTVTTAVTVERRSSGSWLTRWKASRDKGSSNDTEFVEVTKLEATAAEAPTPPPKDPRPNPVKALSETALHAATSAFKSRHPPQRSNTMGPTVTASRAVAPLPPLPVAAPVAAPVVANPTPENQAVTTVNNVPTWLFNACNALNFLTAEHPRAMTTISAILITAGSLPTIPAIAGGTVLASGVAQAVGAIAVGVGNLLKAQQEGQVQLSNQPQAPAGHRPPMRAATFQ